MKQLFSADNAVFAGIGKLGDLVGLSLLWALCCLPLFTIGPASAALYDCAVRCVRKDGDGAVYARFFKTFRANFKVGALTGLIWLFVWALLVLGYGIIAAQAEAGAAFMATLRYVYLGLYLVPAGVCCWLFPLLSRFTFTVKSLNVTALKMAVAHFPATLGVTALTLLCGALCALYFIPLFFAPAVCALLSSFFIERIFNKYAPPEPEAKAE